MALNSTAIRSYCLFPKPQGAFVSIGREIRGVLSGLLWRGIKWSGRPAWGAFALLRVKNLTSADLRLGSPVFPEEPAIRAPNSTAEGTPSEVIYPAIGFRTVSNALVGSNRRVSAIVSGTTLLLPEAVDEGPWNIRVGDPATGGVLRQDSNHVLVRMRQSSPTLSRGIFVGSWSPHNWFHWTIDTLPSVFLTRYLPKEFDDFPILLPESFHARAAWGEPLGLVLGQRKVKLLRENQYTAVKNLVWVDSPTCPGPLPTRAPSGPRFSLHRTAMLAYRDHVLEGLGLDAQGFTQSRRIFLARAHGSYRTYNQEEALKIAAEFGFEPVYLETLSFKESVAVMLNASAVMGPHGAGWANALYCRPGTIGVMWTWDESRHDNWFANIGKLADIDFSTLFTGSIHTNGHNVDPRQLREHLRQRFSNN